MPLKVFLGFRWKYILFVLGRNETDPSMGDMKPLWVRHLIDFLLCERKPQNNSGWKRPQEVSCLDHLWGGTRFYSAWSCCVLKASKARDSTTSLGPIPVPLCHWVGEKYNFIHRLNLSWFQPVFSRSSALQCSEELSSDFLIAPHTGAAVWCPQGCCLSWLSKALVPQPLLTGCVLQPPNIWRSLHWTPWWSLSSVYWAGTETGRSIPGVIW